MPRQLQSLGKIIGHVSYTSLLILAGAVSFVRLVVYARILDLENFALLSKMLIASAVLVVAGHLGTRLAAERDVAAFQTLGHRRRAVATLGQSLAVSTAVAGSILVLGLVGFRPLTMPAADYAAAVSHGWSQLAFATLLIESRSRLAMMQFARDTATRAACIMIAGSLALLIRRSGFDVVLAEAIATALMLPRLAAIARQQARVSWGVLLHLAIKLPPPHVWRASAIFLGGSVLGTISINLDRWIAAETLATHEFGIYAFAWLSMLAAQQVQYVLYAGMQPALVRLQVQGGHQATFRLAARISIGLLAAASLLALALWPVAAFAIERWFTQYRTAGTILAVLGFAAVLRVADFWAGALVAGRREDVYTAIQLGIVAAALLAVLAFVAVSDRPAAGIDFALLALGVSLSSYICNALAAAHLLHGWRR